MIIELRLNKELMELIEMVAERENISVPQWIQDNLESAAIENQKELLYSLYLNGELD